MLILIYYKPAPKSDDLSNFLSIIEPIARNKGFTTISNNPKIYYNKNATEIIAQDLIKNIKAQLNYSKLIKSIEIGKLRKV